MDLTGLLAGGAAEGAGEQAAISRMETVRLAMGAIWENGVM
jgi:hypothetical protein